MRALLIQKDVKLPFRYKQIIASLRALLIQKDVKLRLFSLVLWYSLRALLICRVIKQSTLLCRYPDLRTLLLGDIK